MGLSFTSTAIVLSFGFSWGFSHAALANTWFDYLGQR
jgi:hypothetical protein